MHASADAVRAVPADALSYDHGHLRAAGRPTPATAGVGRRARLVGRASGPDPRRWSGQRDPHRRPAAPARRRCGRRPRLGRFGRRACERARGRGRAQHRGRSQPRRGHDRARRDGRLAGPQPGAGRRGRRPDVHRRGRARGDRLAARAARAHEPREPRAQARSHPRRRRPQGGPGGGARSRRRRRGPHRRGRPGRRDDRERRGGPRHEHSQRRAAAGDARPRRFRAQRLGQRGGAIRSAGRPAGDPERLRGARPPGRACAVGPGAPGPDGRPLRGVLPPGDTAARWGGVAPQRRSGARARRGRGGHALPADPGRADRARVGPLPRGSVRGDRQGRRRDRGPGSGPDGAVRQDRDADRGYARLPRGPRARGLRRRRAASAGRLARSPLDPRARPGTPPGGHRGRARTRGPARHPRATGPGHRRSGRRQACRGRQPRLHARRRHPPGRAGRGRASGSAAKGRARCMCLSRSGGTWAG